MTFQAWVFSAKRAWQKPYVKAMTLLTVALLAGGNGFFLVKMLPKIGTKPVFVLHYNLYLGIDNVGSWRWLFVIPVVWLSLTLLDLLVAFGWFRGDAEASGSLFAFAVTWSVVWVLFLYHLVLLNV